jgi:hypothetical protein
MPSAANEIQAPKMKSIHVLALLLALSVVQAPGNVAFAGDANSSEAAADKDLTPEEKAEKASREGCKVELCKALRARQSSGSDIACHVVKSWRKERLVKLIGKLKVKWPYGGVRCTTDLKVKRSDLIRAVTEKKVEIELPKHTVSCVLASDQKDPTKFKFELTPKVTFEDGKAVKARANWGNIEAPTLIKSALWTATATDNMVNLLSSTIVEEVNKFVSNKCDEVKDQWAAKR